MWERYALDANKIGVVRRALVRQRHAMVQLANARQRGKLHPQLSMATAPISPRRPSTSSNSNASDATVFGIFRV
jgi:hypothetical protein